LPEYRYQTIDFTETFLETFASRDFSKSDRAQFKKALRLLDQNERHPSLRVHALEGDQEGSWAASASDVLRMTFERQAGGRKRMLTCSQHYDR
jgi:mRNA-degrading endonuclease YafQ of YafQ-DinJ toxin-antitoxin module